MYKLICLIRFFSISYKLCNLLEKVLPSNINLSSYKNIMNYHQQIAIEKQHMSQYLWDTQHLLNDTNLSTVCQHDALLLNYEAENWTKLSLNFLRFLERGMFITLPGALPIVEDMENTTVDIISIEKEIIG